MIRPLSASLLALPLLFAGAATAHADGPAFSRHHEAGVTVYRAQAHRPDLRTALAFQAQRDKAEAEAARIANEARRIRATELQTAVLEELQRDVRALAQRPVAGGYGGYGGGYYGGGFGGFYGGGVGFGGRTIRELGFNGFGASGFRGQRFDRLGLPVRPRAQGARPGAVAPSVRPGRRRGVPIRPPASRGAGTRGLAGH